MHRVFPLILFVTYIQLASTDWNRNYGYICNPAECHQENSCYCTERFQGWWNGGAVLADYETSAGRCYKLDMNNRCQCNDCGEADTQCKDWRCNDETGTVIDGTCYTVQDGVSTKADSTIYDYCYKGRGGCSVCPNYGEYRVGCKRTSPGQCVACTNKQDGYFYSSKGSCTLSKCSEPGPGFYISVACSFASNTVIAACKEHPNNKANPGKYYCPGNNQVKLITANSHVNPEYTDYICNDGYYRDFEYCRPCPAGTCCVNQVKYDCPENYFASGQANSRCTKCDMTCTGVYQGKLRRKCQKNSIQNAGTCISCGLCGEWPSTGYNCVLEPSDFSGLKTTCCGDC